MALKAKLGDMLLRTELLEAKIAVLEKEGRLRVGHFGEGLLLVCHPVFRSPAAMPLMEIRIPR